MIIGSQLSRRAGKLWRGVCTVGGVTGDAETDIMETNIIKSRNVAAGAAFFGCGS